MRCAYEAFLSLAIGITAFTSEQLYRCNRCDEYLLEYETNTGTCPRNGCVWCGPECCDVWPELVLALGEPSYYDRCYQRVAPPREGA